MSKKAKKKNHVLIFLLPTILIWIFYLFKKIKMQWNFSDDREPMDALEWKDELMNEMQQIEYKDLEWIGLWNSLFGLDHWVELDENPIYLDYDWFINWTLTKQWDEYIIKLDDNNRTIVRWKVLFETLKKAWETINQITH